MFKKEELICGKTEGFTYHHNCGFQIATSRGLGELSLEKRGEVISTDKNKKFAIQVSFTPYLLTRNLQTDLHIRISKKSLAFEITNFR